jgi:hypothetical protein
MPLTKQHVTVAQKTMMKPAAPKGYLWIFKTKEGKAYSAFYTDEEIQDMKKSHPEIHFIEEVNGD